MILVYLLIFIIGLVFGSFLNAVLWRLKIGKDLQGHSQCPHCRHALSPIDLVPVISFLMLGGRCRYCHRAISWQYPGIELLTACLFLGVFILHVEQLMLLSSNMRSLAIVRDWIVILSLLTLGIFDARHGLLPDIVSIPAFVVLGFINLFLPIFLSGEVERWGVLGFGIIFGAFFFLLQYIASRGRAIGAGDIRFGALMGAILSWPSIWTALTLAYIVGALSAVGFILTGRKKMKGTIALGPFLAIATLIVYSFGDRWLWFYRW